ncbi:MAG TPA: class II fructose-bisphosphatase [Chloroflexota bacterium]|nr:class II fructose-bisphosphatase [Chloroflexota bacterium]
MATATHPLQRNLALELVRVTEAAALHAARWMGRGDKEAADQAAVDAMRDALRYVDMDGVVVIGEGEKDEAPMLYIGERVGTGRAPKVDVAVDPIDGTNLTAKGLPNAITVVALAERGSMYYDPNIVYMEKIAVGKEAKGAIDIHAPVRDNLMRIARFMERNVEDLTVVVLDRPRHEQLIEDIRATGARIKLITDGDVAGAVMAALPGDTGVDVLMGIGGTPEAVLAACALKCLGGEMQCKLWPRSEEERKRAEANGNTDLNRVLTLDDLVKSDDVMFAATGITNGEFLRGVRYRGDYAETYSIMMRARSGTMRRFETHHDIGLKRDLPSGAAYVPD